MSSTTQLGRTRAWPVGERVRVRFWDWWSPREGTIECGAQPGYYRFRWGPHSGECRELATAYETARVERLDAWGDWVRVAVARV